MSHLLHNLLHFGRLLHALGMDVHAGRMLDVAGALEHIDLGRRDDFYFTLSTLLVHRQQDLATFDAAFRVFWRAPRRERSATDLRAMGEQRRFGAPQVDVPHAGTDADAGPALAEPIERVAAMSSGSSQVSRAKDFADYTDEEIEQARAMFAALEWDLGWRRTRRWTAGSRGALDLRRIVRRNVRYGGEPIERPMRARATRRRPLVVVCDVSGSMERYARMLLHFLHSLAGGFDRVEVFLFATRLTRVTRELTGRLAGARVTTIPRRVPDWGGGTRIGEALRALNVRWANRVLGHGPVVLVISDGWDRGEPETLRREVARLQRSCHRLIWLNPLLGSPDYRPLTRGMQAALPFVDDFLPVHNLASLDALARHLNALPPRRARRSRGSRLEGGTSSTGHQISASTA